MSYLAAHPWDAFGDPPPPGRPYNAPEPDWKCAEHDGEHTLPQDCAAALREEAEDSDNEAERLREDAYEAEDRAAECRRLADDLHPIERSPRGQMAVAA